MATTQSTQWRDYLFMGTHGYIVAMERESGREVWRTNLHRTGWNVVTLLLDDDGILFAGTAGRLFALNPATGEIFWRNDLPGLGHGHVCLATVNGNTGSSQDAVIAASVEANSAAATSTH